jgi:outer membrane protein OmpA-like peptidoglycan-associated protein
MFLTISFEGGKMKTKWMILLVCAFFITTGCAGMSKRAKCASVGAATGAAIGATAGGIYGHNKTGAHLRTEWAVVGGGVGAIIGGVTGYLICENDPEPAPAPPVEEVEVVEVVEEVVVVEKIVLNGVQFDFDQAVISDEYIPILDVAVAALQEQGDAKVMITGYTCSIGTEEYNQSLSERRAEAVKAYLVDKGISAGRLMTSGGGESNPIADNNVRDGRMMNRRAELAVME